MILKKVGYSDASQFSNWINQNTDANNHLVLIVANKNGRSYAMADSNGDGYPFVEGAILYKRDLHNSRLISSEISFLVKLLTKLG